MRQYGSRAAPVDTWASTLASTGFDWRGQPVLVLRLIELQGFWLGTFGCLCNKPGGET
jgi:hypothetical protein